MKLQIKTLSPIHIGNGEKYNGLSYIVNRGRIFFYDSTKVMENITSKYSEKFMQWIEQRTTEIERLETQKRNERNEQRKKDINRQLREARKKLSLKEFIENSIKDAIIKDRFNQNFMYEIEFKTQVYNNVDIDCFIKQNNKPYIPGTEIKGAIRTAITYHLLNNGKYAWLNNKLIELQSHFRNTFSILASCKKKGNDFLTLAELRSIPELEIKNLFGDRNGTEVFKKIRANNDPRIKINACKKVLVEKIGKIEEQLQNKLFRANNKDDAKYDLLKFLRIGDSDIKEPSACLFVSDLKTLNISRSFPIFQEFCKEDQTFTCQGFKLNNNKKILDKLGFSDEQKWIVSDVKNLLQCCYEFSNKLLDEEIAYPHYPKSIKDKLAVIKNENKPDSPVIRIGKNEGYLSLTMGLLVKDKDKTLYDEVLCHATKNTSYTGSFPKTRRIVNLDNNDMDTCGWVKLIQIV